jgi:hypothetical protein
LAWQCHNRPSLFLPKKDHSVFLNVWLVKKRSWSGREYSNGHAFIPVNRTVNMLLWSFPVSSCLLYAASWGLGQQEHRATIKTFFNVANDIRAGR